MKKGYYIRMYGKDCFYCTDAKKRTKQLALDFINKVQNKLNRFNNISDSDLLYVQKGMQAATFEIKTCKWGSYTDIKGDNFSFGCDPCENPLDTCVLV